MISDMEPFDDVFKLMSTAGMPCVLIGGLAVSIRSIARVTHDVDFVVAEHDLDGKSILRREAGSCLRRGKRLPNGSMKWIKDDLIL
jgi:hypothetical protein